jgi:uncharacterized membrane protein YhfC
MVSSAILATVAVGGILTVFWPVAILLICRRRMTLAIRNIVIGAGVFIVFSLVLERALHVYLLRLNPATAVWLNGAPIVYALYGCFAAALFEEIGRYLGMRFLVRPTGNPGSAVAYGIGHGGIEAILIGGLGAAQTLVLATLLNSGRFDATLGTSVPPDMLLQMRAGLEHLTAALVVMACLERLVALLIQIGFSLLVWRAVERRRLSWLALAVLLHAAVDFPAGLSQRGLVSVIAVEAGLLIIGAALVVLFLRALPRRNHIADISTGLPAK